MPRVYEEQCQLYIEQEIEEGLARGETAYSIGQEITEWVEKLFGREVKPDTIRKRAERYEQKIMDNVHSRAPEEFTDTEKKIIQLYEENKKEVNEQKKQERKEHIEQQKKDIEEGVVVLPEGKFEVIVIDPPWKYGTPYDYAGRRVANPYPEMTQKE